MTYFLAFLIVLAIAILVLHFRYRAEDHSQYDQPEPALLMDAADVSEAHESVVKKLQAYTKSATPDVAESRRRLEELLHQEVDTNIVPVDVDGIPGEWVLADGADPNKRLLYLHGGAFRVGSPKSHRYLTAELSRRGGIAVLAVDYRMQPEHKLVDCHADARTAYQWMLDNSPEHQEASQPHPAEKLFVAGDSAGGNMTLSLVAWLRDQGLQMPDGAIAMAPLTDMTFSSPTWKSNVETDPFLGPVFAPLLKAPKLLLALGSSRGAGVPTNNPMISPLLGDLSDLPNTLIQVSRDEMLYGDALRYTNKANAQGSAVTLEVWPKMVHVFQGFPELAECDEALTRIRDFIAAQA